MNKENSGGYVKSYKLPKQNKDERSKLTDGEQQVRQKPKTTAHRSRKTAKGITWRKRSALLFGLLFLYLIISFLHSIARKSQKTNAEDIDNEPNAELIYDSTDVDEYDPIIDDIETDMEEETTSEADEMDIDLP